MLKQFSKVFVVLSAGLVLAAGFLAAGEGGQNQARSGQNLSNQALSRMKVLFVDENGDGICDFALDHDGDGIPNRQDPDWTRPQDGTGLKAGRGYIGGGSGMTGKNQFRNLQNQGLNKQSFRSGGQSGGAICNGSGLRGQARRAGKN